MSPNTLEAFVELARRDAAVQEQVAEALNHVDPVHALMAVTESAGFRLTEAELRASLGGPLSDEALEGVSGGSSKEWFAEMYRSIPRRQIESD